MTEDIQKYFAEKSIMTGVVRYNDLCYLIATVDSLVEERVPHSLVYTFDRGQLGADHLQWTALSASVCRTPEERFLAISEHGFVHAVGGGTKVEEPAIASGELSPRTRGPLREVRGIAGGRAYAVGTARQAYRREAPGQWTCIDQSAQRPDQDMSDYSFESIDGFSEEDIYVVGWEGEVWRWDGTQWAQQDSPTKLALHKVRCADDGVVYACGQVGTLLRGRAGTWKPVEHGATREDIWGLEWFNGALYVSTTRFVYRLVGDTLERVDFGDDSPDTCYHLSGADGIMWSIGSYDVMEFDGSTWKRIV